jgi:N-methylhydantoinase B/oxoprolinase/acetone carboxylase alpha subunit
VAENEDLDLLLTFRPHPQHEQLEQAPQRPFTGRLLKAGSTIEIAIPNSGGYGDPLERDPEAVLSDVLDGFTTADLADREYGVVLDLASRSIDAEATGRLRSVRHAGVADGVLA